MFNVFGYFLKTNQMNNMGEHNCKPTLEEVKEHFKDAKVVKCLASGEKFYLDLSKKMQYDLGIDLLDQNTFSGNKEYCVLWYDNKGYAEIVKPTLNTKPKHYKTDSIDVIDFCKIQDLNFNLGNVVKYVCRNKDSDIEDYKKAIDYLQREIKHLEK